VGSSLAFEWRGKRSSLLRYGYSYGRKKFYITGPGWGNVRAIPNLIERQAHSVKVISLVPSHLISITFALQDIHHNVRMVT